MNLKTFWYAAFERAGKSAAQTLILLWAGNQGLDILKVNVEHSFSLAGGAAVLSLLTSIVSAGVGNSGPSLATETLAPTPPAN
jgi:hypothetical protein